MLSPTEKRCVLKILEEVARMLADPDVREDLERRGLEPGPITVADLAEDVLNAAAQGQDADDGRWNVYVLGEMTADVRELLDRDPLIGCPPDVLDSMDDAHLAVYLNDLARGDSSQHAWGIPRRTNVADLKASLMPPD